MEQVNQKSSSPVTERWNAPAAAASHKSYFSDFTILNKPHSQSLNAPNPPLERFIDVCTRNFHLRTASSHYYAVRAASLAGTRPVFQIWYVTQPPNTLKSCSSVLMIQLRVLVGDPSQVQHILTREEPSCLHPHLDFSPAIARAEAANPHWSEGKAHEYTRSTFRTPGLLLLL